MNVRHVEASDLVAVMALAAEVIGPERLLVIASVGIVGDHTQAELATILREIERRLLEHKYIGLAVLTLATSDDE